MPEEVIEILNDAQSFHQSKALDKFVNYAWEILRALDKMMDIKH